MNDRAQRWLSILVGAGVIGLMAWITVAQHERQPHAEGDAATPSVAPVLDAAPSQAPTTFGTDTASADGGLSLLAFLADAGASLPHGAPRSLKLGVVLVQFTGAEGAPSSARAKRDALAYAQKLAADAKTDFKRAVKDGDPGSAEDIGRIPRGVLDPQTEVAVFSLAPGQVSDVLETARGYWIVKRAE